MAQYFIEPYIDYHTRLTANTSVVSNSNVAVEKSNTLVRGINNFQNLTNSVSWTELGFNEIVEYSVPALKSKIDKLNKNIENHLKNVCNKSINELLPKLEQLKQKDQTLSDLNAEIARLKAALAEEKNSNLSNIEGSISEKSAEAEKLEKELKDLQKVIDELVESIKKIDSCVEDFSTSSDGSGNLFELSPEEKKEFGTFEEQVKKYAEEHGITYDEALEILENKKEDTPTGKTILYNDTGSVKEGYSRTILTSFGKTIKVYQQAWSKNLPFNHKGDRHEGKTLAGHGCGHHALTSILTSVIPNITPEEVFELANGRVMCQSTAASVCKKLRQKNYNVSVSEHHTELKKKDYEAYKRWIISEVKKGNMGLSSVGRGPDAKYTQTTPGHWVAIVDYDEASNKFYISDSADEKDENAEPIDADLFLKTYDVDTLIVYV